MRLIALCALLGCGRVGFAEATDSSGGDIAVAPADLVLHVAFDADGLLLDRARGHELLCVDCPAGATGRIAEAALFGGTSCITVTDAADLRPSTFTLAAWFYSGNQAGTVISRPFNGATDIYNTWMLYIGGGPSWFFEYNSADAFAVPLPSPSTWHHVAGTFDGNMLTLYFDGVRAAGPTAVDPPQYAADPIMIGCDRDADVIGGLWPGLLDDLRVYSRALAATEIAELAAL